MRTFRISMAQINPTVGDLKGNRDKIIAYINRAKKLGADIVVFTELAVTGYPPEDLILKPQFVKDNLRTLREITRATRGITAIVGYVDSNDHIYDAAAIISNGKLVHVYHKMLLPNYGVFDEYRYFKPGNRFPVITVKGVNIGVNICEDIWYADGPSRTQTLAGAEIIIAVNASPYHKGKGKERLRMLALRAKENNVFVVYTNAVGGQDELVFDGHSMILDPKGKLLAAGKQFEEELISYDIKLSGPPRRGADTASELIVNEHRDYIDSVVISDKPAARKKPIPPARIARPYTLCEEVYRALVLGTRDYMKKTGFKAVVIGISGGIDSSLVAAVAVAAIGRENVHGVFMPSEFSSDESCEDATELARNLGIKMFSIPIHQPFNAFLNTLRGVFAHTKQDVTEENLQARTRGNILMALSNKFGWLVLTTGNKSELSTGYATLYGDMAGGFAVIKDVPKTLVYDICRCINRLEGKTIIPKRVLVKAPTAELRPDQKDSDSLPEYEELDPILKAYVEDDKEFDEMLRMGFDRKTVERVIRLVDSSEYKRRQAPPGVKITPRGLGKDRRFPITNRYKSY
ncbi:MAG TPA: NAD+ synthase [Nitrospirota bacterium]|nr:NAD+ synthase [Nitrospirota bacterium]